jgi:hypothetical protein
MDIGRIFFELCKHIYNNYLLHLITAILVVSVIYGILRRVEQKQRLPPSRHLRVVKSKPTKQKPTRKGPSPERFKPRDLINNLVRHPVKGK